LGWAVSCARQVHAAIVMTLIAKIFLRTTAF
jgi:hypothetical protein